MFNAEQLTDLSAERNLLGAIFVAETKGKSIVDAVTENIKVEDFSSVKNRIIYNAMAKIHEKGEIVDVVSLSSCLQKTLINRETGQTGLDMIGLLMLTDIANAVPTDVNWRVSAKQVKDMSVRRRLRDSFAILQSSLMRGDDSLEHIIDLARRSLDAVEAGGFAERKELPRLNKSVSKVFYEMEHGLQNYIPTGIPSLDRKIDGFYRGSLVIVSARPSTGKTAFTGQLFKNMAEKGYKVLYFSLEMTEQGPARRLIANYANINSRRLVPHDGKPVPVETQVTAINSMQNMRYETAQANAAFIDASEHSWGIDDILRAIRAYKQPPEPVDAKTGKQYGGIGGVDVVFIDYVDFLTEMTEADDKRQSLVRVLGQIANRLKSIAIKENIAIVLISQLSRSVEGRQDKHPILSDIRNSGELEQAADVVIALYREEMNNPDSPLKNVLEIELLKVRDLGDVGRVPAFYFRDVSRILPMTQEQENAYYEYEKMSVAQRQHAKSIFGTTSWKGINGIVKKPEQATLLNASYQAPLSEQYKDKLQDYHATHDAPLDNAGMSEDEKNAYEEEDTE